jgi:hypothetical protein
MKRVFLSFRAEDKPQVNGLRLLASNPNFDLEFYDESVRAEIKSSNAEYIKRVIREKISRSSVTVCLLSGLTHTSEWVSWELEESAKYRKKIICMGLPNVTGNLHLPRFNYHPPLQWYLWNIDQLHRLIAEN